jgi:excisionase family DNA binding protein
VLDVQMTAELLTVSADTVYDLFKRGELPGRKVGRKWLTTRNAVLRWIESSSEDDTTTVRKRRALRTEKAAVLAPMERASDSTATVVTAGVRRRARAAWRNPNIASQCSSRCAAASQSWKRNMSGCDSSALLVSRANRTLGTTR